MSPYTAAFGLGFVAGLRSQTPLALLSQAAVRHPDRVAGTPFHWLARPPVATLLALAAAGELVADKLPFLPDRIAPGPLLGRLLFGALAGTVACAQRRGALPLGAVLGAVGGFVGSHIGYRFRGLLTRRLKLPALVAGLTEDSVTLALGRYLLGE
jgi:uncharacterized membrane protein